MSEVTVIATIVCKSNAAGTVKRELAKLIVPTRKEEGCIRYVLHTDNASPSTFVFYENWESAKHLKRHMNTDHFKQFQKALDGLTEEIVIQELTRHT
ncbi:MAG: putative quinol monooxygenase [Desulforhopalus sp.]